MKIDIGLIKILLLALPGIVALLLYRKLTGADTKKQWHVVFQIMLFSLISYGALGCIYWTLRLIPGLDCQLSFFDSLLSERDQQFRWNEVLYASLIAIPVALLASLVYTFSIINRIGCKIRVTKRIFDGDIWEYFNYREDFQWVFVRDHKVDLLYFGWVMAYSETGTDREIILRDVQVFPNTNNAGQLYTVHALYLSRNQDDLTIEAQPTDR